MAGYPGQFGTVLVKKETLDKSLKTIEGAPVIINHTDVTVDNADDLRVGVISNAYYNEQDGWYWCEGVIWDETAQSLITDKKWSVSCSYDFLEQDDEGGTENNIPYDREFTKLNFVHLALVDNPRYERANIVFNSKTVGNSFPDHEGRPGQVGGSLPREKGQNQQSENKSKLRDYKTFLNAHKAAGLIEKYPDDFLGKTDEDIAKHLGIEGNKPAEFKTPIETIKIYKNNIPHIRHETDKTRLLGLNKAIRTLQAPNLIIQNKKENYYIKFFDKKGQDKTHLQVIKTTPKGGFYKTNFPMSKNKFEKLEGQVIYDLSSKRGLTSKSIITNNSKNFNPDITKNEVDNEQASRGCKAAADTRLMRAQRKEQDMALLEELKKLISTVENSKGEEMQDKDKEVDNEKVDKRDIIRQIMAIAGKHEDNEDVRTIAKLAEKLAYDKSEAGTSDNKKEVKNEDDKAKDESKKSDDKEKDVDNKKKTCDNSVDNSKTDYYQRMNEIYNASTTPPKQDEYVSRADRLKAAEEYFS